MILNGKLKKVCEDFSLLDETQQDYIIGILQALVFAKDTNNQSGSETETVTQKPGLDNPA